jgi:uncharacterized membrane protein YgcG
VGHAEHFEGAADVPLGAPRARRAAAGSTRRRPPLRVAVEALLAGRGLGPARVVAEASGWEAMLTLARLNVGVALINDIVPCPPTLVSRPVRGLPAVVYRCVTRRRRGGGGRRADGGIDSGAGGGAGDAVVAGALKPAHFVGRGTSTWGWS